MMNVSGKCKGAILRILLTNDDGIDAVGIAALRDAVSSLPQVTQVVVVAPRDHLSGVSHRVTTDHPISVERRADNVYAVDGTPADCVRLALREISPDIDWVFSGVNDGGNLGVDIHMSGTVAAAREATLMNVPAISWSQYVQRPEEVCWESAKAMVLATWSRLASLSLGRGNYWNVNFPHRPAAPPPVIMCSPDKSPLPVDFRPMRSGGYQYRGSYAARPRTQGRDVDVCFGGKVAVSKLSSAPG